MKLMSLLTAMVLLAGTAFAWQVSQQQNSPIAVNQGSTDWRIETLEVIGGGSSGVDLKLDKLDSPRIAYRPPTRVMHAVRASAAWNISHVASTYWGTVAGNVQCLAIDSKGISHVLFDNAGLYHAVRIGTGWKIEEVDKVSAPTTWVSCKAAFDSHDRLHVAYATKVFPNRPGEVKYAFYNGTAWSIERIDVGGLTAYWVSIAVDSHDRPHILYYADSYQEVRYAYRPDDGHWGKEVVESGSFVGYGGVHGSLRLDSKDYPHAAYLAFLNPSGNSATLRYAVRNSTQWTYENIAGPGPREGLFVSMDLDSSDRPHIAYIRVDIRDPVSDFDIDLLYATKNSGKWEFENIMHGEENEPEPWFTSIEVDRCKNPHIATFVFYEQAVKYATKGNCISNRPPTANANGPYIGSEGTPLTLTATASDPDNDPLAYRWDFDNDGTADTSWSSSPAITHIWPDDYTGTVRVEVSDNKTTANATATVTILNLPPTLDSFSIPAINATAKLRISGEKWHDVSAYLVDDGKETLITTLTRQPGKPQETSFPVTIDPTRGKAIKVVYTPDDDKVNGNRNGANPAWLTFTFDGGGEETLHHTFNVKHPDTWNWTVSLNQLLAGREIEFAATATDLGMDDLAFTWEWGDGTPASAMTYLNGGTFPFTATDEETHAYGLVGTYDLKVTVSDDDGDAVSITFGVLII